MDDKLMYIPNDDTQKYFFCRLKYLFKSLNTTSLETTNQIQWKYLKFGNQRMIKIKHGYKTLGTSVINSLMPAFTSSLLMGRENGRLDNYQENLWVSMINKEVYADMKFDIV